MKPKNILFDLDGTLTDSGPGIFNCAELALRHFGLPVPSRQELRSIVGPPLRESFPRLGVRPDQVEEAIRVYRGRYMTVGKYENEPYPGIREMLAELNRMGYRLFVATSKPESMAIDILTKFELDPYFVRICGAAMDGVRDTKSSVIAYLMEEESLTDGCVMIGDTVYDVLGAFEHHIPTIGVKWGYGDHNQMLDAGAITLAEDPADLLNILRKE